LSKDDERALVRLREIARARASHEPAHDFLHVQRVAAAAQRIAEVEGADVTIVTAAALLHELFNYPKGHAESQLSGERCAEEARAVLVAEAWSAPRSEAIAYCIRVHSFSRGIVPETLEAKVLQDADRLDAIGAVGIARCFATCADMKRPFYANDDPLCRAREPNDKQWGVDHFFKKLLRIEAGLHTPTAREMAAQRTRFMYAFLAQLDREINGERDPT
jgi:uncharacterized protein